MVKKKEKKNAEPGEKKSRAKFNCPDKINKLRPFLEKVNKVPAKYTMLDSREVFANNKPLYRTPDGAAWASPDGALQTYKKSIKDCFEGLPEAFCNYIEKKGRQNARVYENEKYYEFFLLKRILTAYHEFYQLRDDLINYVKYFTNWRKHHYESFGTDGIYGADGEIIGLPPARAIYEKHDETVGTVTKVVPYGLSEALNGIIGERVRFCEICTEIFWAKRDESETCSPRCFGILRTRRYRTLTDEEKAQRKAQREANKQRNKKLKEIKEKKNGTL